jgi:hypothetical protein
MADFMTHDSLERPSLDIAEVAVLGEVDKQEEHHNKRDATFHRDYRL